MGYEVLKEGEGQGLEQVGWEVYGREREARVLYLLPNGVMGTGFMVNGGERAIGEGDVEVFGEGRGVGVGVWE